MKRLLIASAVAAVLLAYAARIVAAEPAAPLQPGTGTQYYVAPDGKPDADGSKEHPWDLASAMVSKTVKGGDTIWLRGGTYTCRSADPNEKHAIQNWTLRGEKDNPIMVAQYPGERAIIVGRVQILAPAAYTWFWDLEFSSLATNRTSKEPVSWPPGDLDSNGIDVMDNQETEGPGLKFIGVVIHDTNSSGMNLWHQAIDAELNGCLMYYNGWTGPDRGHGHGIYTQNRTGIKKIVDNIMFKNFQHGIQMYGSGEAWVDGYDYIGNVSFNNGAIGGRLEVNLYISPVNCEQWHFLIDDNFCYHAASPDYTCTCIGYVFHKAPYEKIALHNNRFGNATYLYWWKNVEATGNIFYGKVSEVPLPDSKEKFATFDRATNAFLTERPKGVETFVRPNQYEVGRANIVIYNWDLKDAVEVDLKNLLPQGAGYEIRDVQNFFGDPIVKGAYDGKPISIRMKDLKVADPIGIAPDPLLKSTAPEFGVFVVLPMDRKAP